MNIALLTSSLSCFNWLASKDRSDRIGSFLGGFNNSFSFSNNHSHLHSQLHQYPQHNHRVLIPTYVFSQAFSLNFINL